MVTLRPCYTVRFVVPRIVRVNAAFVQLACYTYNEVVCKLERFRLVWFRRINGIRRYYPLTCGNYRFWEWGLDATSCRRGVTRCSGSCSLKKGATVVARSRTESCFREWQLELIWQRFCRWRGEGVLPVAMTGATLLAKALRDKLLKNCTVYNGFLGSRVTWTLVFGSNVHGIHCMFEFYS